MVNTTTPMTILKVIRDHSKLSLMSESKELPLVLESSVYLRVLAMVDLMYHTQIRDSQVMKEPELRLSPTREERRPMKPRNLKLNIMLVSTEIESWECTLPST
jgi:hypothetical protein